MPLDTMVSVCVCVCVYTQLRLTLCNPVDHNPQAPLSVGFPRLEYWSGSPFPSLGDLPDLGIEPTSHVSAALAGGFFTTKPIAVPELDFSVYMSLIISEVIRGVCVDGLLYVLYMCFHKFSIEFLSIPKFEKPQRNYSVRTETNNYVLRTKSPPNLWTLSLAFKPPPNPPPVQT